MTSPGLPTLSLALLLAAPTLAGPLASGRINLPAAQQCACLVSNLPCPPTMPTIKDDPRWTIPVKDICCDRYGNRISGHATSILSINYITGARSITLSQSAGFEHAVHELAADAFVQSGGNKWDLPARERVGYQAEWAAKDCKR